MWCIPPEQDAAFVCQMEQVLEVYKRPYDAKRPVVCMDEQPKQLISEVSQPTAGAPGQPARVDYEYVREGVCTLWMFVEPLGGWRDVPVGDTKRALDWAYQVRRLVQQPRYRDAERITLVCDNLNTHTFASLYQAFEPQEALRLVRKLELVYTPQARELAERGGVGTERADAAVPRPAYRPAGHGRRRSGRMGPRPQRETDGRRLAVHHRRRPHPAQAPVPETERVMDY